MKKIISSMTMKTEKQKITPDAAHTAGLTIGIDLGDQWSQLCFLTAEGKKIEEARVRTTRSALEARLSALAPARIAMETGTHSLWASELLTALATR